MQTSFTVIAALCLVCMLSFHSFCEAAMVKDKELAEQGKKVMDDVNKLYQLMLDRVKDSEQFAEMKESFMEFRQKIDKLFADIANNELTEKWKNTLEKTREQLMDMMKQFSKMVKDNLTATKAA